MNKIAVVVDSGLDLPEEYKKEDVFVLPLKVVRDGITYLDGVTISPLQVAEELLDPKNTHEYKTSLVAPGEVSDFLETVKEKGYTQVIAISISSGLSGTYNAFVTGAQTVNDLEVEVIDTLSIGVGAGLHAVAAVDLIAAGNDFVTTVKILRDNISKSKVYFCVGTLEFLIKGGRIGKVTGFVGKVLNLKPVITCDFEGIYSTVAKVRGRLQGLNHIVDLIVENFKNYPHIYVGVANCSQPEDLEYVKNEISKKLNNIDRLFTGVISPALTVHAGPLLIGITAYPK